MAETIYVVADTSGSMCEMSKLVVIKNLVRYIHECSSFAPLKSMQLVYRYFLWGESFNELDIASDELEQVLAAGRAELPPLQQKLDAILAEEKSLKVILFSDGNYPRELIADFQNWRNEKEGVAIRAISIGGDSNNLKLASLSTNGIVFSPEDVSAAIESLIFNPDNSESSPGRIPKIAFKIPEKSGQK